ncbi:MAG: hypothetical protein H6Q66_3028 [Firmicutes bacterium]|nr:hypothetical protein [Bacillota bacterium]
MVLVKLVLTTLNAKYIHSSLAIRYLREYCRQTRVAVITKEYTINNSLHDMLADLYAQEPDVVAFACYIWNIDMMLQLASMLRKVLPKAVIVFGGPEVSYCPEKLLEQHHYIDYIIMGEGENTLNTLLSKLLNEEDVTNISGIAYRNQTGMVICSGKPQIVDCLSALPFAYDDRDMEELKDKIIYYESSRGCPFSCQYCLSSAAAGVRFLPVERVLAEMDFFILHKVKQVKFVDRTFNASKTHCFAIWKYLCNVQCETNFHFEISAELLDEEMLAFLKTVPVGRFQFEIGVQSTNEATLEAIQRRNNWPLIVKNVERIISYGNIHVHLDLIVGLPYETYASFSRSFDQVYGLYPDMLQIGFLKMLKGTGIREQSAEHNYVYVDQAPYEVLSNRYLSYREVRQLKIMEDLFNQLYNSGRFIHTLSWLIELYGQGAFAFYTDFAKYWEASGLHAKAHSPKTIYRVIAEFSQTFAPEKQDICLEWLKFDALLHRAASKDTEFLPWNGEKWLPEKNALWREPAKMQYYVPSYFFSNWRAVKNGFPIEVFKVNIPEYLQHGGSLQLGNTPVLFYENLHERKYSRLRDADFWMIEG